MAADSVNSERREAPPQDGSPVLDPVKLQELRALDPTGAARLMPRVLTTYLGSMARLHDEFHLALGAADWPIVGRAAHTLKSSSASIGALALSRLCAELEARVRDGAQAGIPALVPDFERLYAQAREAVQRLLATEEGAA